ncbi:HNH endonuclease [Brucella intermedia]|uniref:HNH endonuclease n=1 Tax=Brucella intermedia TaxID=94625 RepID=UPI00209A858E|nr:HNH endonuclease [Brucella intermedia]MCO7739192.1 HNH endonuclease [Brucella intermedia]
MTDSRSAEAKKYRRHYKSAKWKRIREAQLQMQPLCEYCLQSEIVEPATVVHHGEGGHKGDEKRFWTGPFVSLCKACHDRDGQREDLGQTVIRFDAEGWPIG